MKIYVVGSSKNKFLPLDNIREKFLIDEKHEGDNIDFLNPWYCELTGLYYLWKHVDDNIVGLEHYRRYFVNEKGNLLSEGEINEILKDNDVICRKWVFKEHKQKNAMEVLKIAGIVPYLNKFLTTVSKEEKDFILYCLNDNDHFEQCNMCICKSNVITKWLSWFIEHAAVFTSKEVFYKPRVIGYLAEFLFGIFLKYNGYKITYAKSFTYNTAVTKIMEICV